MAGRVGGDIFELGEGLWWAAKVTKNILKFTITKTFTKETF